VGNWGGDEKWEGEWENKENKILLNVLICSNFKKILEYAQNGSLFFEVKRKRKLREKEAFVYFV